MIVHLWSYPNKTFKAVSVWVGALVDQQINKYSSKGPMYLVLLLVCRGEDGQLSLRCMAMFVTI